MKVTVDPDLCIGCGMCASESVAAEVFEIDEASYKAKVKAGADVEGNGDKVKEAAEMCPVGAIKIED